MTQTKYLSSIFFALLLVASIARADQAAQETTAAPAAEETAATDAQQTSEKAGTEAVAETPAQPETMPTGSVARSAFATGVQDHEPVDQINTLTNDNNKIYFFTELKDLKGQRAVHRWEHNGEIVAEVPFSVGGDRWRVWSSKNLQSEWTGDWKVSVLNGSGEVIATKEFQYEAAPEKPAITETAPTEEQTSEPNKASAVADTPGELRANESASDVGKQ